MKECEKLGRALQGLSEAQRKGLTDDDPWDGLGDASFSMDDGLDGLRAGASYPDGIYACLESVVFVFACDPDEAVERVYSRIRRFE